MKRIEIVSHLGCDSRCRFCPSWRVPDQAADLRAVAGQLLHYSRLGVREVDFGGGEPTLREDLPKLLSIARKLSYARRGILTHAWKFGDPRYVESCIRAGLTDVTFSVWGWDEESYEALCGIPGSYRNLIEGMGHCRSSGLGMAANVMLSADGSGRLAKVVSGLAERGVTEVWIKRPSLWGLDSSVPSASLSVRAELAAKDIATLMDHGMSPSVRVRTTHVPVCLLGEAREFYAPPTELGLQVVTPGGSFDVSKSPTEGGTWAEPCKTCSWKGRCLGPRAEDIEAGVAAFLRPFS